MSWGGAGGSGLELGRGERLVWTTVCVGKRFVVESMKGERGKGWRFTYASVGFLALVLAGEDGAGGAEGGAEIAGWVGWMYACGGLSPEWDLEDGGKRSECGRELHVG